MSLLKLQDGQSAGSSIGVRLPSSPQHIAAAEAQCASSLLVLHEGQTNKDKVAAKPSQERNKQQHSAQKQVTATTATQGKEMGQPSNTLPFNVFYAPPSVVRTPQEREPCKWKCCVSNRGKGFEMHLCTTQTQGASALQKNSLLSSQFWWSFFGDAMLATNPIFTELSPRVA